MYAKIASFGVSGIGGYPVSVEVKISNGLPAFDVVRLPDAAVKESRERVRAAIKNAGFKARDLYKYQKAQYRKSQLSMVQAFLLVGSIIIIISLIEVFLMMRASFLSRIKEVGTLRAIGVKKSDIHRMFTGEIIAITVIASVPGWLFMNYIIYKLHNISYLSGMFICTPQTVIVSLALIFGFNLLFGLLPVFHTLIKRPAAILARTDVN